MDKSVGTPQIYLLMGSPLTMMWKVVYRIWTKPTKKLTQEFLHFSLRVSNITLAQNAVGKAVLRGCCILNRFLFQEHRLSFFLLSIQQAFSKQSTHELLSKYPMWQAKRAPCHALQCRTGSAVHRCGEWFWWGSGSVQGGKAEMKGATSLPAHQPPRLTELYYYIPATMLSTL